MATFSTALSIHQEEGDRILGACVWTHDDVEQKQTRTTLGRAQTSIKLNSLPFVSHCYAGSGLGHEPKSDPLVLVTYPTHPPSFVITHP